MFPWLPTATGLEVARTAIAACGTVAALVALWFAVGDYLLLRRDGTSAETSIVYAQKIVGASIFLVVQVAYTAVGIAAMLAPPPIPEEVRAILTGISANATVSVASYLEFAVSASIFVSSVVLAGSLWQFATRHLLLRELRRQIAQATGADRLPRERVADERTATADDRTTVADHRTEVADARARSADARDVVANARDATAARRDDAADLRDDEADAREGWRR